MKIIVRRTGDGDFMFDTNSETVYISEYKGCLHTGNSNKMFCNGEKSKVQAMFDAIVAAEKRGDKFFDIND